MDTHLAAFYHPDAMKTLLILVSLLLTHPAPACIWIDGTTLDGQHRQIERKFPDEALREAILLTPEDKLDQLLSSKPGPTYVSDLQGVKELLSGNPAQAIAIFQQEETGNPGRYTTAANLGTAFELHGDLDSALKWIQEGIRRNPDSHFGTEWLHVEILKTRIKLRENPRYLHDHHVIPLPDSFTKATTIRIGEQDHFVQMIAQAIHYQLLERMVFVKAPDPVVADLLFTYGRIESQISIVESARRLLIMSYNYGIADPSIITRELDRYDQALAAVKARKILRTTLWSTAVLLTIALLLRLAWKTKHFFLTRKACNQHRATPPSP